MTDLGRHPAAQGVQIASITGEPLSLKLVEPLVTSAATYRRRDTLLVRCELEAEGGQRVVSGFGEAAPLDGWTDEGVDDCAACLEQLQRRVVDIAVGDLPEMVGRGWSFPSLRFALEGAVLDGLARLEGLALRDLLVARPGGQMGDASAGLAGGAAATVGVQTVIGDGSVDETRRAACRAVRDGATALKLKVGNGAVSRDVARVKAVRDVDAEATIRVDANGAWSVEQALRAFDSLGPLNVDLVEQPVSASRRDELLDLAARSELDVAADESCTSLDAARALVDDGIDALVLKPGALGAPLEVRALMDYAADCGVRVVVSSLIESAVGRTTAAHLAACCDADGPHGLGVGSWLAEDVSRSRDAIVGGRMQLSDAPGLGFEPRLPPRPPTSEVP